MSKWKLPPEGHPVREMLRDTDLNSLTVERILSLPTLQQARKTARKVFAIGPGVTLYHALVLRADGSVVLKSFGRKGGDRTRWNFGHWESDPDPYAEIAKRMQLRDYQAMKDA